MIKKRGTSAESGKQKTHTSIMNMKDKKIEELFCDFRKGIFKVTNPGRESGKTIRLIGGIIIVLVLMMLATIIILKPNLLQPGMCGGASVVILPCLIL